MTILRNNILTYAGTFELFTLIWTRNRSVVWFRCSNLQKCSIYLSIADWLHNSFSIILYVLSLQLYICRAKSFIVLHSTNLLICLWWLVITPYLDFHLVDVQPDWLILVGWVHITYIFLNVCPMIQNDGQRVAQNSQCDYWYLALE